VGRLAILGRERILAAHVVGEIDRSVRRVHPQHAEEMVDVVAVRLGQIDRRRPGQTVVVRVGQKDVEVAAVVPVGLPGGAGPVGLGHARLVKGEHRRVDAPIEFRVGAAVGVDLDLVLRISLTLSGDRAVVTRTVVGSNLLS